MSYFNKLQISILSFVVLVIMGQNSWGLAPRTVTKRDLSPNLDTRLPLESDSEEWYFSRFAVTIAPFAEIDLKLLELKIQPYVEIRFDRRVNR